MFLYVKEHMIYANHYHQEINYIKHKVEIISKLSRNSRRIKLLFKQLTILFLMHVYKKLIEGTRENSFASTIFLLFDGF